MNQRDSEVGEIGYIFQSYKINAELILAENFNYDYKQMNIKIDICLFTIKTELGIM